MLSFLPCQTLCVPEQRPKQKMPAPGLGMLCTPPGSQTVELISGVIRRWARLGAIQVSSSSRLVLDASPGAGLSLPLDLGSQPSETGVSASHVLHKNPGGGVGKWWVLRSCSPLHVWFNLLCVPAIVGGLGDFPAAPGTLPTQVCSHPGRTHLNFCFLRSLTG